MTSTDLVVSFAQEPCRDIAIAGGKGANLAVLSTAGMPVPGGFCITTQAYEVFASSIGLDNRVVALLARIDSSAANLETLTAELRDHITSSPLPESIAREVLAAYQSLKANSYVAVRSSGTAEDLAGASFAGPHDTYLDIRGEEALLDAVKRCWASMWTARARVVTNLRDIGVVEAGDILITNSTDPGWTPVFALLKGIVLETGGMLAHGSCLAREHGLPAIQIAGATKSIPDGSTITVNGDTGEIRIHDEENLS